MISVIVPIYNSERYLEKCVNSILNQTFQDFEIILIDDGSTDSSPFICDKLAENKKITVYHLKNGGPSKARNFGIKKAKGDYLSFVDSDDFISENMLEKLLVSIGDADIAIGNFYIYDNKINICMDHGLENRTYLKNDIKTNIMPGFFYSNIDGLPSLCNKLYRKSFIIKNDILLNEQLIRAEDFWFNYSAFVNAEKIISITDPVYFYVQVEGSTMHQIRDSQFDEWVNNRKILLQKSENLMELDYNKFYAKFIYNVSVYIRSIMINKKYKKALDILSDEFYLYAIKFNKFLPFHIRLLNYFTFLNKYISFVLYFVWSRI